MLTPTRFFFTGVFLVSSLLVSAQTASLWWKDAVFYEVFVRSFYDANGDGKGDLNGLIQKLDYLNDGNPETNTDLGVDALWLMPIMPSPSYHGYDVTDYYGVESDYGNRQLFQNLIDSAHARGIRVIIDLVMNHSSSQHPWFTSSRSSTSSQYRDWYVWSSTNPGNSGPWGQQVWHQSSGNYYYGIFWDGMPDLNFKTPAVQQEMKNVTKFWLDSMHVDGFRLDAIQYLVENGNQLAGQPETFSFLEDWKTDYLPHNPEAMTVGEVWSGVHGAPVQYVQPGGLDLCFEFELAESIISGINANSPDDFQDQLGYVLQSYPEGKYATFLTNHDMNRANDQLGSSLPKNKLAAATYLTLPGTPFLYYGEEIGMTGTGSDEVKRRPMQWSSGAKAGFTTGNAWTTINSNYTTVNAASQSNDPESLLSTYRNLISLRHQYPALSTGSCKLLFDSSPAVFGYARYTENELILVVHNFGSMAVNGLELTIPATGYAAGTYAVADLLDPSAPPALLSIDSQGGSPGYQPGVEIGAYQTRVFHVDQAVAIGESSDAYKAQLFPNPGSSVIHLQLEKGMLVKQVDAINAAGQHFQLDVSGSTLNIERLAAGMYMLVIRSKSSDNPVVKRFVKQ